MFEPLVGILNRLATTFLGSSTGKYGRQTTGLFSLLAVGFVFLSFIVIGAIGMIGEGNPNLPASVLAFVLVPLVLAAGCFWLVFPGAWSDASYTPRTIVLMAVGLSLMLFGFGLVSMNFSTPRWSDGLFDILFTMTWAFFNFAIAGACLWAAIPSSWKNPGTSREEVPS